MFCLSLPLHEVWLLRTSVTVRTFLLTEADPESGGTTGEQEREAENRTEVVYVHIAVCGVAVLVLPVVGDMAKED